MLAALVGAVISAVVSTSWARSAGVLHQLLTYPKGPDTESAQLVTAHWRVSEPDDDGRRPAVLEVRNGSEEPILGIQALLPDGTTRSIGALRRGDRTTETTYLVAGEVPSLRVEFVLGQTEWRITDDGVESLATPGQLAETEAARTTVRTARVVAYVIAGLLGTGFLAFLIAPYFEKEEPPRVDYVVTPSREGENPFSDAFNPRLGTPLNTDASSAWARGEVAATYALTPTKDGDRPTDVSFRGDSVTIVCIMEDAPLGAMAKDVFGDLIFVRDITQRSRGIEPAPCE